MDSALLKWRVITPETKATLSHIQSSTTALKVGLIFWLFFFDLFFIINDILFVREKRCLDFNVNLKMQFLKWKMLFQVK